jgi:hypothetical protein
MAVFGIDDDGMLAYVNSQAVRQWPQWSSALGGDPEPSMQQMLVVLEEAALRSDTDGLHTDIDGRNARVWVRPLTGQQPLGCLMLVQLPQDAEAVAPESTA